MRLKPAISFVIAALLGTVAGVAVYVGYVLPGVLPTSDLFVYLVASEWGLAALHATSGKAGLMIAIAMRAFPYSVALGIVAGLCLWRFTFPRVFCYSALCLPVIRTVVGYVSISEISKSAPHYVSALEGRFGEVLWVHLCVYGWYFLALYLAYVISSRYRSSAVA